MSIATISRKLPIKPLGAALILRIQNNATVFPAGLAPKSVSKDDYRNLQSTPAFLLSLVPAYFVNWKDFTGEPGDFQFQTTLEFFIKCFFQLSDTLSYSDQADLVVEELAELFSNTGLHYEESFPEFSGISGFEVQGIWCSAGSRDDSLVERNIGSVGVTVKISGAAVQLG